jgi:hypothetical protein
LKYLCSRRLKAPVPGDANPIDHANIGVVDTVEKARGKLVKQLLVEAIFAECEADVHRAVWKRDVARRLRRVADEVVKLPDAVYGSVEVDGVRYGWVRLTNDDAARLCTPA